MKKALILLALLSLIVLHNDHSKTIIYNLWNYTSAGWSPVMGGELLSGKNVIGNGYTGEFLLRSWGKRQRDEFLRVPFNLKIDEKIIIHLPIIIPHTGKIIKGKNI